MLTDAELSALRPPERLPVSAWIEANRVLHESYAAEPGPKKIDRTPFVKPILDAWLDPWVREIVVSKSAQIGLTDLAIDLVGHTAANDPSPMAVFLADQLTAEKVMTDRVQAMLRSTACLKAFIDENRITKGEAYLRNGFNLTCSWASSIAQTASRPFKHLILDEINKPGYSATGEEGSALGRLRQRQETFADSKLLMMSTPTGEAGNVTREMNSCDVIYDWCVPCPKCGAFQPLRWTAQTVGERKTGGVVWDGGMTATLEQIEASARYQCGECQALWTTTEKNTAVLLGQSMPRGPVPPRARRVGFQLNRIMSLFPGGRLEKLVLDFIEAKKSLPDLQNFINSALGEPWVERVRESKEDDFAHVRVDLPRGVVPEEAVVLTAGIDTQQDGFWYGIRAWAPDSTSWLIDCGYLPTWQELEELLFSTTFRTASGRELRVWRALIDSGGTKKDGENVSRTEEIYHWVRKNGVGRGCRVFCCKGSSKQLQGNVILGSPIDKTPSGKPMPGGIQIVSVDTDKLKDAVWYCLDQAKDHAPQAAYVSLDTPDFWFKHMTAEEKRRNRDGSTEWVRVRKDNHLLDCEVYLRASVDWGLLGGLRVFQRRPEPEKKPDAQDAPKQQPAINPFTGRPAAGNPYTRR